MSVFIPGMEMPKSCHGCWITDYCLENHFGIFANGNGKPCPLVEIKAPHGRLIDGDALAASVTEEAMKHTIIGDLMRHTIGAGEVISMLEKAQTIIEAEGGSEDG